MSMQFSLLFVTHKDIRYKKHYKERNYMYHLLYWRPTQSIITIHNNSFNLNENFCNSYLNQISPAFYFYVNNVTHFSGKSQIQMT